jgi:hypothetical protein
MKVRNSGLVVKGHPFPDGSADGTPGRLMERLGIIPPIDILYGGSVSRSTVMQARIPIVIRTLPDTPASAADVPPVHGLIRIDVPDAGELRGILEAGLDIEGKGVNDRFETENAVEYFTGRPAGRTATRTGSPPA